MAGTNGSMASAEIYVEGRVQGVGYRFFTERKAGEMGVKGWSMNLPDGRVMLEVEGDKGVLEQFIDELKAGPSMSNVKKVKVSWMPYQGKFKYFTIKV
ncbi:MAG TPA: acylphosphatase [Nitrospirota bacterium]|jgi:acylphosphatase